MNPIADYVKKVERHLPAARRLQVAGALHAALKARKEALEKANGRKASEAEIADMLRAEGEPEQVAQRLSGAPGEPELVTRYLASIERRLPREGALDVMAELREALLARIETEETRLGRQATPDDVAAIIKDFGAPAVVAARYEGRTALIGPVLYPWFWPAQRVAVGITLAIFIVLIAMRAFVSDEPIRVMLRSVDSVLHWGLTAFAIVTLVFIGVERWGDPVKLAERNWDPKLLPRDNIRPPKSLFESAISLFFEMLFILFWLKLLPFPNEVPTREGASVSLVLSPAWSALYWPILALALLAAASHVHDMILPAWNRIRSAVRIAGYAAGLIILWLLVRARPLIDVLPLAGTTPADLERATRLVDGVLTVSLGVTALIWAITISVEVWRQIRAARPAPRASTYAT